MTRLTNARGRRGIASTSAATLVWAVLACGDPPTEPSAVDPVVSRADAGRSFTCAVSDGTVLCWGANDAGQLGDGTTLDRLNPTPIESDLPFLSVSAAATGRHACAVAEDGAAYCWGENDFGQRGDGTLEQSAVPIAVAGGRRFATISAGWRFTCAVTGGGQAWCWGRGEWGQLGNGLATGSPEPVMVSGDLTLREIAVGGNNLVCGLTEDGTAFCWGLNFHGALGSPTTNLCTRGDGFTLQCATVPQAVGGSQRFSSITAGAAFACGITTSRDTVCWGLNSSGQLGSAIVEFCEQPGLNPQPCASSPVQVSGSLEFQHVAAGDRHACGLTTEGAAHCWGWNEFGQLGNSVVGGSLTAPTPVLGDLTFRSLTAGDNHTCGETVDGQLFCWGANDRGQLGTGNTNIGLLPVAVTGAI